MTERKPSFGEALARRLQEHMAEPPREPMPRFLWSMWDYMRETMRLESELGHARRALQDQNALEVENERLRALLAAALERRQT